MNWIISIDQIGNKTLFSPCKKEKNKISNTRKKKQRKKKQQNPNRFFGVKFHNIGNKQSCVSLLSGSHSEQNWGTQAWQLLIHSNFRYLHPNFLGPLTQILVRVSLSHPFFFLSLPPSLFPAPHVACDRPREERANQARR